AQDEYVAVGIRVEGKDLGRNPRRGRATPDLCLVARPGVFGLVPLDGNREVQRLEWRGSKVGLKRPRRLQVCLVIDTAIMARHADVALEEVHCEAGVLLDPG